jgi:hypothetical protein
MSNATVETHWDCNCTHHYIQPRSKAKCELCQSEQDEAPDSMVSEVADGTELA